jgi:CheY-like chemotaxis protein
MSLADKSPDFGAKHAGAFGAEPLSVALIGPDEARRSAVARAVAETQRASVREFDSYPPELEHLQRLLASFDVVIIDLDSEPDVALELVEKAHASDAAAVMVYSENADPKLAVRSMRAGARECLLLPIEPGVVDDALLRTASVLREKPLPAEKTLGRLIVKPERWKITDDKDATRMQWYGDTGLAETWTSGISQEKAGSTAGRSAPQEKRRDFDLKGLGRNTAQVDSGNGNPSAEMRTAPAITWPTPDPITYGDKLTAAQRDATASVPGTFVYTPGPGHLLPVGTHTLWVTFTPADTENNGPVLAATSIVVGKAVPVLSWPTPVEIVCGTALDSAQLNASASIPGRFEYSHALGEVLAAGKHTLSVTFTPADSENYNTARATVSLTVARAMPSITWPAPDPITYGEKLTTARLNAATSAPGTLVYTPGPGHVLPVGIHTLWATFTPADPDTDDSLLASTSIVVSKAKPVLSWPTPAEITCGTALSDALLNASASTAGTFEYSPALGEVLSPGTHTLSVTFTPADSENYATAQATVLLTVTRAMSTITWPTPDPITYGMQLSAAQLRAKASVAGTFKYIPGLGAVLAVGEHNLSAVFTPADTLGYSPSQTTVSLTVAKAAPAITWPAVDPIAYGAALGVTQLNAKATVPGSFSYLPAAGEILEPGVHELSVTFTPTDTLNYTTAHAVVSLSVTEQLPYTITWSDPSAISYGTALSATELNAEASVPGTFVYTPSAGLILAPGVYTLSASFTPADTEKYAKAQAAVVLHVETSSDVASSPAAATQIPAAQISTADNSGPADSIPAEATSEPNAVSTKPRETRIYKGAVYEKGEDDQWHLQKK